MRPSYGDITATLEAMAPASRHLSRRLCSMLITWPSFESLPVVWAFQMIVDHNRLAW